MASTPVVVEVVSTCHKQLWKAAVVCAGVFRSVRSDDQMRAAKKCFGCCRKGSCDHEGTRFRSWSHNVGGLGNCPQDTIHPRQGFRARPTGRASSFLKFLLFCSEFLWLGFTCWYLRPGAWYRWVVCLGRHGQMCDILLVVKNRFNVFSKGICFGHSQFFKQRQTVTFSRRPIRCK